MLFKRLLKLPGTVVKEAFKSIDMNVLNSRFRDLENFDKAVVLLRIALLTNSKVFIFNDFASGIPGYRSMRGQVLYAGSGLVLQHCNNTRPDPYHRADAKRGGRGNRLSCPYLDYDKYIPKRSKDPVGSSCQGRGEVPSPVYNLFVEKDFFEFSDNLERPRSFYDFRANL